MEINYQKVVDSIIISEEDSYRFGCYGFKTHDGRIGYVGSTNPPNNIYERVTKFNVELFYEGSGVYGNRGHIPDFIRTLGMVINNEVRWFSDEKNNNRKFYCLDYRLNPYTLKPNWDGFINWYKMNMMLTEWEVRQAFEVVCLTPANGSREEEARLIAQYKPICNIEYDAAFNEKYDKHDLECRIFCDRVAKYYPNTIYPTEKIFTL